jgi:hypothetical protein
MPGVERSFDPRWKPESIASSGPPAVRGPPVMTVSAADRFGVALC